MSDTNVVQAESLIDSSNVVHDWFMSQVKRYGGCYVQIEGDGAVRYTWGKNNERELEQEIEILKEELKQYKADNGIFGAGA